MDVFFMGQGVFQPEVTWVHVAIHSLIQSFTIKSICYGPRSPLHRPQSRWAAKHIQQSLKNKFHKIIGGASWQEPFHLAPLFPR